MKRKKQVEIVTVSDRTAKRMRADHFAQVPQKADSSLAQSALDHARFAIMSMGQMKLWLADYLAGLENDYVRFKGTDRTKLRSKEERDALDRLVRSHEERIAEVTGWINDAAYWFPTEDEKPKFDAYRAKLGKPTAWWMRENRRRRAELEKLAKAVSKLEK